MALESYSKDKTCKLILETYPEGVYVYVFEGDEKSPSKDHLQNTLDIAKKQAYEDYNVEPETWNEISNICLHGKH